MYLKNIYYNNQLGKPACVFPGGGAAAVGGSLPGLVGATSPSVMMKPFLPFPETPSPVGLFPNFNTVRHGVTTERVSAPQTDANLC